MNFHISKTEKITADEALFVVRQIVNRLAGVNNLEIAYKVINIFLHDALFWDCGKAGSHIWVSKNDEKLITITE